jgi:hypothetical protein
MPQLSTPNLIVTARRLARCSRPESATEKLEELCPAVAAELRCLRQRPFALPLWGLCQNVDELANRTITSPGVLTAIGNLSGVPMQSPIIHAGLQHTYGYLFSLIKTPHGYKRDRWIAPSLDQAFGFRRRVLQALPSQGTLLGNLTYFLGRIAFRTRRRELSILARMRPAISPQLPEFAFRRLQRQRIVETVHLRHRSKDSVQIRIITDLVEFPASVTAEDGSSSLLVYSVVDSRSRLAQLITAFPVTETFVADLVSPDQLGRKVSVRPRFNAIIPGLGSAPRNGTRHLE